MKIINCSLWEAILGPLGFPIEAINDLNSTFLTYGCPKDERIVFIIFVPDIKHLNRTFPDAFYR
jgi:hypothetical protein